MRKKLRNKVKKLLNPRKAFKENGSNLNVGT